MTHERHQIRVAVADMLARNTDAEDRVYRTRSVPWRSVELPGIAVYTLEEESEPIDGDRGDCLTRQMALSVIAVAPDGDDVDDALDELSLQIETTLQGSHNFGLAFVQRSFLEKTEMGVTTESGRSVGFVQHTYRVRYDTAPRAAA